MFLGIARPLLLAGTFFVLLSRSSYSSSALAQEGTRSAQPHLVSAKELLEYLESQPSRREAELLENNTHGERLADLNIRIGDSQRRGRFDEAVTLAERALSIRAEVGQTSKSWEVRNDRLRLATIRHILTLSENAQEALAEAYWGDLEAKALLDAFKIDEGLALVSKQLKARRQWLGDDNPEVLRSLLNAALFHLATLDTDSAMKRMREVMDLASKIHAGDHPDVATMFRINGMILVLQDEPRVARSAFTDLVMMSARLYGATDRTVLEGMGLLANAMRLSGEWSDAEALARRAVKGLEDTAATPTVDANRIVCLNMLATILLSRGDLAGAEVQIRASLALLRSRGWDRLPLRGTMLANLALILMYKGDLRRAQNVGEEALAALKELHSGDSAPIVLCLNNLALIAQMSGDTEAGIKYFREAQSMQVRLTGWNSQTVARISLNVAQLALSEEYLKLAETSCRNALDIYEKISAPNHPDALEASVTLGGILLAKEDYSSAKSILCQLLPRIRDRHGSEHLMTILTLFFLAKTHLGLNDLASAEPLLREAVQIGERQRSAIVGDERSRATRSDYLGLPKVCTLLADTLQRQGRTDEAFAMLERGRSRAFLDLLARRDVDLVAQLLKRGDEVLARALADALESEQEAQRALQVAEAQVIRAQRATSRPATHSLRGLKTARRRLGDSQATTIGLLQKVWPSADSASTAEIRAALSDDDLLLMFNWSSDNVVLLLVPPLDRGPVEYLRIAEGRDARRELRKLVRLFVEPLGSSPGERKAASQPAGSILTEIQAVAIYQRLFPERIRARVWGASRIVLLPDGPLNGLPFESLVVNEDGDRWLESGPEIAYAASGTMYRRLDEHRNVKANGQMSAIILGDPIFTEGPIADVPSARQPAADESPSVQEDKAPISEQYPLGTAEKAIQFSEQEIVRLFGAPLPRLKGTAHEAKAVMSVMRGAGVEVVALVRSNATLVSLSKAVSGKRFCHLATHGLSGTEDHPYDSCLVLSKSSGTDVQVVELLTLDSIIASWRGRLEQCDLVVLSACHTYKGVDVGDSVVSLPWGFFYAGAPTVIASLWKVDDDATAILMEEFYRNLLEHHLSKSESLRNSKLALRTLTREERDRRVAMWTDSTTHRESKRESRSRGGIGPVVRAAKGTLHNAFPYEDPHYWAAFVLIGRPD